jgi:hypothetical protein
MTKVSLGMLAVSFMFVTLIARAQEGSFQPLDLSSTSTCVIPKVDGERVPFPGRTMNAKFELAENESYLLNGTLTVSAGKVYLKVDFASQPWLETEKMKAHPYFEVTSLTVAQARQYARKLVQVAVVTSGDRTSGLTLSPILPPVLSER